MYNLIIINFRIEKNDIKYNLLLINNISFFYEADDNTIIPVFIPHIYFIN